jgi:hypothetical protein
MTRKERSIQNSINREKRAKKLVKDTITGLYSDEFKWASGKWNIKAIAEHTGLHRDTVSKHVNLFNDIIHKKGF